MLILQKKQQIDSNILEKLGIAICYMHMAIFQYNSPPWLEEE